MAVHASFEAPPPNFGGIAMAFIGVDLHSNSFTICRLKTDTEEEFESFQLSMDDVKRFCLGLDAEDSLAVEATSNSAGVCDQVRSCVGRLVVVNARRFELIRKSVNKTDRNDARARAYFLSKDMFPGTRLRTHAETELGALVQTRDVLVKQRTMLLNRIHAIFTRHGIKLKKEGLSSKRSLTDLSISQFTPVKQIELGVLRDQALRLTDTLKRLDKAIEKTAEQIDGYEEISSIKGIGARSAAILLAGIGNVDDFASADKLAAYFGSVPRVSQSDETDNRGKITKRGDRRVRTTLVQYTLIAIKYSGCLNAFYQRIKARRGAGQASIATPRKFLSIICDTLKNRRIFEDFTKVKIKENQCPAGHPS